MSDVIADEAWRFLRGHSRAEMRFDEHLRPIRYVVGPKGRMVAPVMAAMLQVVDCVMYVPECRDDAMALDVTLEPFDEHGEDGALADRWRIHHGSPPDLYWAFLDVDAARYQGSIIDGAALVRPNPLAEAESRLCRRINLRHREGLAALCRRALDVQVREPVMVAIDSLGIDVRGNYTVIRIEAPEPMTTPDEAEHALEQMMADAEHGKD